MKIEFVRVIIIIITKSKKEDMKILIIPASN